jgi:hypothetical protein
MLFPPPACSNRKDVHAETRQQARREIHKFLFEPGNGLPKNHVRQYKRGCIAGLIFMEQYCSPIKNLSGRELAYLSKNGSYELIKEKGFPVGDVRKIASEFFSVSYLWACEICSQGVRQCIDSHEYGYALGDILTDPEFFVRVALNIFKREIELCQQKTRKYIWKPKAITPPFRIYCGEIWALQGFNKPNSDFFYTTKSLPQFPINPMNRFFDVEDFIEFKKDRYGLLHKYRDDKEWDDLSP